MSGTDPVLAELLLVLVGAPAADPALPSMQVLCLVCETCLCCICALGNGATAPSHKQDGLSRDFFKFFFLNLQVSLWCC